MISLPMTVKTFLESLKSTPIKGPVIRLVSGNQSCDMDSVVSAIAYLYLHSKKFPSEQQFVPILNIPKAELKLRKDIVLLLESNKINSSLLYFLDDVQKWENQFPDTSFEVALVDHCNLQGDVLTNLYAQKKLDVVAIIDHHEDERAFLEANPRVIQTCGSCSSLVFDYWNSQGTANIDSSVVKLLLGPLLIDTSNMSQKVEQGDVTAIQEYKEILSNSGFPIDSVNEFAVDGAKNNFELVYDNLKKAKKNLDGFLPFDIFRKDYKQFVFETKSNEHVSIGFSSIGKSLSWLLKNYKKSQFLEGLEDMQKTHSLDIVLLTTSFSRGEAKTHAREFCYYAHNPKYANLADFTSSLKLNSDVYKYDSIEEKISKINKKVIFKVYNMGNTEASRKQVVPEIKKIIENDY